MASIDERRLRRMRVRGSLLCCAMLTATASPTRAADRPVIALSEPDGFTNLTGAATVMVDLFFGGRRIGDAQAVVAPGTVTFSDARSVVDLLPALKDRELVEAALAADGLDAHAGLACAQGSDRNSCGRLSPAVAGVIYNRDSFRVDIFLNPTLLAAPDITVDRYLPPPAAGLSVVNSVGVALAGQTHSGKDYFSVFDQLVLSHGEKRLRADISSGTGIGTRAEYLALEWDRPGLRYSAGAIWAPGSDLTGRRKLLGVALESQTDTRIDRDDLQGSPLFVFLDQRARIDVVQDGRVLGSAVYESGNQKIDTSNLPDGSYDIVLRIDAPGMQVREERRLFTKNRRIPSLGRTDFLAYAGILIDGSQRGAWAPPRDPFFQAALSHRITENWAVGGSFEGVETGGSVELSATFLARGAQVRASAYADTQGSYGGILQLASAGSSRLNYTLDLRKHARGGTHGPMAGGFEAFSAASPFGDYRDPSSGGSFSQFGGHLSYSIADLRILGTAFFRQDEHETARYSIGPAIEWDVVRRGPLSLTMRGDMATSERGTSGFAGVSLRWLGANGSIAASAGARASDIRHDGDDGNGLVAGIAGSLNRQIAGGELTLGAGYEHRPKEDAGTFSTEFVHPVGWLAGDLVHSNRREGGASTQYGLGFQTTVAAGEGAVSLAGKSATGSLIVARVQGASEEDRFEVLVNEQVMGEVSGRESLTLSLPQYRAYDVRVRSTGDRLLAYNGTSRKITLYPGSVRHIEWTVEAMSIMVGRLVYTDGSPVSGASITGSGIWSETDADGYFQLEAPAGARLSVAHAGGQGEPIVLPAGEGKGGNIRLGDIVCCRRDATRLGAVSGIK